MNWKRFFAAVFALLVVLSLGSTKVGAQTTTTGDIAGVVTDPSGATVPGAKVRSEGRDEGQHARVHDEQGRRVPLLLAFTWTVHLNGERDGISVVQPPLECRGRPNRER